MISITSLRLFATIIALSLITSTSAAVVTVYGVDAPKVTPGTTRDLPQPSVEWAGTQTASAIGPGESGRTKYEVKYIQSRVVLHHAGGQQVTFVSEPMTATYTHEQGGNLVIQKGDPWIKTIGTGGTIDQVGLNVECTLDDKHESGVCAGEQLHPILTEVLSGTQTVLATATETVKTTYTGSVFPIATLTTGGTGSVAGSRSTILSLLTLALGAILAL